MGQVVRVRTPATSANLGPGYDCLGLALDLHDELEVRVSASGRTHVDVEGVGAGIVPTGPRNLVARTILGVYRTLGIPAPALALHCRNVIPHASGLGSSASAIVAGVLAARALVGGEASLDDSDVFALATEAEGHPDNVAPCLFGGFTIAWMEGDTPRATAVPVLASIIPVVCVPDYASSTREARKLVPSRFPKEDVVANLARAALLVEALSRDSSLLLDATEDRLHQPYRAEAMRPSADLVDALRSGSIPAVISGAGPTVLALCRDEAEARSAEQVAMSRDDAAWTVRRAAIVDGGATVEDR